MIVLTGNGIIECRTDVDFFSFKSGNGDISINVNPAQFAPNLDILAELYDSSGTLISSSNPVDSLNASINETGLPAGEYFIKVDGVDKGDPQVTGYSDYASLGNYTISGSVPIDTLSSVTAITTGDIDGNGQDDLIVNFGSGSVIYKLINNSTWSAN